MSQTMQSRKRSLQRSSTSKTFVPSQKTGRNSNTRTSTSPVMSKSIWDDFSHFFDFQDDSPRIHLELNFGKSRHSQNATHVLVRQCFMRFLPIFFRLRKIRGSRGLVGSREVLHTWGAGGVRCPFYSDEGPPAPNCRRPEGHGAACKPAEVAGR